MKFSRHIDWMTEYPTIHWKGYEWQMDMESGRKIHPWEPGEFYDCNAVDLESDVLNLTVLDHPTNVSHWNGMSYSPRFGRGLIRSVSGDFSYGTYTLRCRLPKGRWLHSSFWLSSADSWPPEIDIFEAYSGCLGLYNQIFGRKIETNCHYHNFRDELNEEIEGSHDQIGGNTCPWKTVPDPIDRVSEYKLVWTPDFIIVYYNENIVRHVSDLEYPDLFADLNNHPKMHVMINTGIRKEWMSKYKEFDRNPEFHPVFQVLDFRYEPLIKDL